MKIAVHVPTQHQSEAVQKACFDKGVVWSLGDMKTKYLDATGINLNEGKCLSKSAIEFYKQEGYTIITPDEFFANIDKYLAPVIKVGDHIVSGINKDGFKVGCQFVSWQTFDAIGKLRPE